MSTAIDTISIEDLDSMYENELVCGWCGAEAHWAWKHDDVMHFNCHQCKRDNEIVMNMLLTLGEKDSYCNGCNKVILLEHITFIPI